MNISNSVQGIEQAFSRQASSASRVANITTAESEAGGNNLAGEMVGQITNRHAVALNTEAIRTTDSMLGEVLDLQA